jgi:hypothetical protein
MTKGISAGEWARMGELERGILMMAVTAEVETGDLVPEEIREKFLKLLARGERQGLTYVNRYLARL